VATEVEGSLVHQGDILIARPVVPLGKRSDSVGDVREPATEMSWVPPYLRREMIWFGGKIWGPSLFCLDMAWFYTDLLMFGSAKLRIPVRQMTFHRGLCRYETQELIRRWDSERELVLRRHLACRGQRLRPL